MLLHNLLKNNVNNFQRILTKFSESIVVRGLTHHFHQKHKLNTIQCATQRFTIDFVPHCKSRLNCCISYISITVVLCDFVLCDFAVLYFFLCSFVFVGFLFFCMCVFFLLRWPARWTFVFSGNLPQCCVLSELLYCGLIKFFLLLARFSQNSVEM